MAQLMDNLIPVLQACVLSAVMRIGSTIRRELMRAIAAREREQLTKALGHEPDDENLEDYRQLSREQTSEQKACQREEDRKKIRRLIEGDSDAA